MFKQQSWRLLGLCWLLLPNVIQAADLANLMSGEMMVVGSDNIYGAGKTETPFLGSATLEFPNNLTGGGTLPKLLQLPAKAQEVVFTNISGEVQCCSGATQNTADGGTFGLGKTALNEFENLSGIRLDKTMFLVGVFLADQPTTPPATLDFNGMTDFEQLSPALQQVFFIGDGKNSEGKLQSFNIPQGATQLFLGFADGNEQGQVGFYNDNLGFLTVDYQMFGESTIVFQPPPTLNEGLLGYYTFEDKVEYNDGTTTFIGNALDRSGFNFHARLGSRISDSNQSGVHFTFQPTKYGKSVTFYSGELALGSYGTRLLQGSWSIATWFYHTPPRQNYSVVQPRLLTLSEYCGPSPLYIEQGELGTWACVYPENNPFPSGVFIGTGFTINQLAEGWHHLAAISNDTTIDYFMDGHKVGQVQLTGRTGTRGEGAATHGYVFLGGSDGLTLDDFRIYNRRLTAQEVAILAEQPAEVAEDSCTAHYQWTGLLTIPCLTVGDSAHSYRVELQADVPTAPTALRLKNIVEKQ
ncbi:MAG: LamG-like jellyroll fold domain-containing protein [Thiotrichaceae bacterium]